MNDMIHNLDIPYEVTDHLNQFKCPFCKENLKINHRATYYDGVYETFARCSKPYKKDLFTEFEVIVFWNFSSKLSHNIYIDSSAYGFIENNNLYLMRHYNYPNMPLQFNDNAFSVDIEVYSLNYNDEYIPDDVKMNFCTKPSYFDFDNISSKELAKKIHQVAILR